VIAILLRNETPAKDHKAMSASHDPKQPSTFIYSSLYELYQRSQTTPSTSSLLTGQVLKTNDPRWIAPSESKQLTCWSENASMNESKKSMAKTLNDLRQARKKLNFMIAEMDELIKRTS